MPNYDELRATAARAIKSGALVAPTRLDVKAEAERTRQVATIYAVLPRNLRHTLLKLTDLDSHRVQYHVRKLK